MTEDDVQEGIGHHHEIENTPQDLTIHSMGSLDKDKQVVQHPQEAKGRQFLMMFLRKLILR